MTTLRKDGGRSIELLLPFEHEGKTISVIGIAPVTWHHTLKWQGGEYARSLDLLFELSEQSQDILHLLRYPDVDRVMTQFFEMLPREISEAIAAGTIPRKVQIPQVSEKEEVLPEEFEEPIIAPAPDDDDDEPVAPKEVHDPYRPPTKEEIAEDMRSHPPPADPFGHLKQDETGLGFEVDDGR